MAGDTNIGECCEHGVPLICACKHCDAPSGIPSTALLAAEFADFWHAKWPHQTRDVKKLEMSAHYVGCREAFYAGVKAANAGAHRT